MTIALRYIGLACLLTAVASARAHPGGSSRLDRAPQNLSETVLLGMLPFASGQSEPVERVLADTKEYVTVSGAHTRCGKYFVFETTKYGEFEVKQVRVAYVIPTGIAVRGLYYNDLAVVLDEARKTPVLLQKRENPGLEKDTIELSRAAYEEAKACLPPPAEPSAQQRCISPVREGIVAAHGDLRTVCLPQTLY
jgi:hypothetical protein